MHSPPVSVHFRLPSIIEQPRVLRLLTMMPSKRRVGALLTAIPAFGSIALLLMQRGTAPTNGPLQP